MRKASTHTFLKLSKLYPIFLIALLSLTILSPFFIPPAHAGAIWNGNSFDDGFEAGNTNAWTYGAGTITSAYVYDGLYSDHNPNGLWETCYGGSDTVDHVCMRAYFYWTAYPASQSYFMSATTGGDSQGAICDAFIDSSGTLYVGDIQSGNYYIHTTSFTVPLNTWHCIELDYLASADPDSTKVYLYYDGTQYVATNSANSRSSFVGGAYWTKSGTMDYYMDLGAVHQSYIGTQTGYPTNHKTLTLSAASPAGSGTMKLNSTTQGAGSYIYTTGDTANLTAVPAGNWTFDHWHIDSTDYGTNPYYLVMSTDHTAQAVFTSTVRQITMLTVVGTYDSIQINGTTVSPGTYYFNSTDTIMLQATAGTNYAFDYWDINTTGNVYENPYNLTMSSNCTVTAHFRSTGTHDVAVTNVASKTVVCQGCDFNITVGVADSGSYQETFNLTLYVTIFILHQNVTLQVASQNVTLESGNYANITFVVNTAGYPYGNYTMSAYAWPVPGETNTADNSFTGGWVFVSMPGDLTGSIPGVPDGKVDIRDISLVAKAFGSTPRTPGWNANCDVNNDGKIDIRDIALVAKHFGESTQYP